MTKTQYEPEHKTLLPDGWRRWVLENKLLGVQDKKMISIMVKSGLDKQIASTEVDRVAAHPYFAVAQEIFHKLSKLESLMIIRDQLSATAAQPFTIERRNNLSSDEFLERYYSKNRPVILTDLMDGWQACNKWTPEHLRQEYGREVVEVMVNRDSDQDYEVNAHLHKQSMEFSTYINMVESADKSNDFYLVANNHLLARPRMQSLMKDIEAPEKYLNPRDWRGKVFLWYGPQGTVTPMHHDPVNILMMQVRGRKRIKMVAPEQTQSVYNSRGVFSDVDCDNPDYSKHPLFRNAKVHEIILSPREALFLPVGWWHHVVSLDTSITVTFINFLFSNSYSWSPSFQKHETNWQRRRVSK